MSAFRLTQIFKVEFNDPKKTEFFYTSEEAAQTDMNVAHILYPGSKSPRMTTHILKEEFVNEEEQ